MSKNYVKITQHKSHWGFKWHIDCKKCGSHFEHTDVYFLSEIRYDYCLVASDGSVVCPNC